MGRGDDDDDGGGGGRGGRGDDDASFRPDAIAPPPPPPPPPPTTHPTAEAKKAPAARRTPGELKRSLTLDDVFRGSDGAEDDDADDADDRAGRGWVEVAGAVGGGTGGEMGGEGATRARPILRTLGATGGGAPGGTSSSSPSFRPASIAPPSTEKKPSSSRRPGELKRSLTLDDVFRGAEEEVGDGAGGAVGGGGPLPPSPGGGGADAAAADDAAHLAHHNSSSTAVRGNATAAAAGGGRNHNSYSSNETDESSFFPSTRDRLGALTKPFAGRKPFSSESSEGGDVSPSPYAPSRRFSSRVPSRRSHQQQDDRPPPRRWSSFTVGSDPSWSLAGSSLQSAVPDGASVASNASSGLGSSGHSDAKSRGSTKSSVSIKSTKSLGSATLARGSLGRSGGGGESPRSGRSRRASMESQGPTPVTKPAPRRPRRRRSSFESAPGDHCVTFFGGGLGSRQHDINQLHRMVTDLVRTVQLQNDQIQSLQGTVRERSATINHLKDRVRTLERWAVLASPIPGWGEKPGFSLAMESFLAHFKAQIISACAGTGHGRISLVAPEEFGPWFDYSILLPYWRELGDALRRPSATTDARSFQVKDVRLGKRTMDLLAPGLNASPFRALYFENNDFGRDGINFVMDAIERNPHLETLHLAKNPIEKAKDVTRLVDLVGRHPALARLVVEDCGSWTPSDLLYPLLTASDRLKHVCLEGNNIATMGRASFADFLSTDASRRLESVSLKDNQLNDDDVQHHPQVARPVGNNVTSLGRDALLRAIFDPADLNAVSDSNHTCGFVLDVDGPRRAAGTINVRYGPLRRAIEMGLPAPNVPKKVKLLARLSAPRAACATEAVRLLDGVPLGLMPEVLEFVQGYPPVRYVHPDGVREEAHWERMAEMRRDAPSGIEGDNGGGGGIGARGGGGARRPSSPSQGIDDSRSRHSVPPAIRPLDDWEEDVDEEESEARLARAKRLDMVFGVMRGWRTETGEPLCCNAIGRHVEKASIWNDSVEFRNIRIVYEGGCD
ncbi:hypothetical protein ACHAWF_008501 [Thalassiosira exigua]